MPLLVEIAHLATPREVRRVRLGYVLMAFVVVLAVGGAGAVGFLRLSGVV